MSDNETGQVVYETMFVWNEFLTRGIRNILHNTLWTVALAYGFFKQVNVCFVCTLLGMINQLSSGNYSWSLGRLEFSVKTIFFLNLKKL